MPYLIRNRRAFVPIMFCAATFLMSVLAVSGWGSILLFRNLAMTPVAVGVTLGITSLVAGLIAAPLGGWLSDSFVRRDPEAGRMTLLLWLLPTTALSSLMLMAVNIPAIVILGFALLGVTATIVSSLLITILSELVSSEGRGQIASLFGLVSMVCGMGFAPTLVALVTDNVCRDESKLPLSLAAVSLPALTIATVLAFVSLPHVSELRARVMNRADDNADRTRM